MEKEKTLLCVTCLKPVAFPKSPQSGTQTKQNKQFFLREFFRVSTSTYQDLVEKCGSDDFSWMEWCPSCSKTAEDAKMFCRTIYEAQKGLNASFVKIKNTIMASELVNSENAATQLHIGLRILRDHIKENDVKVPGDLIRQKVNREVEESGNEDKDSDKEQSFPKAKARKTKRYFEIAKHEKTKPKTNYRLKQAAGPGGSETVTQKDCVTIKTELKVEIFPNSEEEAVNGDNSVMGNLNNVHGDVNEDLYLTPGHSASQTNFLNITGGTGIKRSASESDLVYDDLDLESVEGDADPRNIFSDSFLGTHGPHINILDFDNNLTKKRKKAKVPRYSEFRNRRVEDYIRTCHEVLQRGGTQSAVNAQQTQEPVPVNRVPDPAIPVPVAPDYIIPVPVAMPIVQDESREVGQEPLTNTLPSEDMQSENIAPSVSGGGKGKKRKWPVVFGSFSESTNVRRTSSRLSRRSIILQDSAAEKGENSVDSTVCRVERKTRSATAAAKESGNPSQERKVKSGDKSVEVHQCAHCGKSCRSRGGLTLHTQAMHLCRQCRVFCSNRYCEKCQAEPAKRRGGKNE